MSRDAVYRLLLIVCVAGSAAVPAADELLRLQIDEGVAISPGVGLKSEPTDLIIDLRVRDGRIEDRGWAWVKDFVGVEHPVQVLEQTAGEASLRLRLQIEIRDRFPYLEGGSVIANLDLEQYGKSLRGSYHTETTVLSEAERQALWRKALSMDYRADLARARLRAGAAGSRAVDEVAAAGSSQRAVVAHGELRPAPLRPTAKAGSGRLVPQQVLAQAQNAGYLEQLRAQLASPQNSGALYAGERISNTAFLALGHLWLALQGGEASAVQVAERHVEGALQKELPHSHEQRWQYARSLSALALLADLGRDRLSPGFHGKLLGRLRAEAIHVAGLEGMVRQSVYNDRGLIGSPDGDHSPHLLLVRAAALLAVLACEDPQAPDALLVEAREICLRSVRRCIEASFGSSGAPIGHSAADELVELVMPVAFATRSALGVDLLQGTGMALAGEWALATRGLMFEAGAVDESFWRPLSAWAVPEARRRYAIVADSALPTANPWQSVWAGILHPQGRLPSTRKAEPLPPIWEDAASGCLVLRDPRSESGLMAIIETAQADGAVAGAMGRVSIASLARQWLRRPHYPSGAFVYPDYRQQNLLLIDAHDAARLPPVVPVSPAKVQRVRVAPDGSGGSIGWKSGGFKQIVGNRLESLGDGVNLADNSGHPQTWTAIGVDYSRASGAEMLAVVVSGHGGFKGRPVTWQMDIGSVSEKEVRFEDHRFTVRPTDSDMTLVGQVVYPPSSRFIYVPESKDHGARIQVWMKIPPMDLDEAFLGSISAKLTDLSGFTLAQDNVRVDVNAGLDISDIDNIGGPSPAELAERARRAVPAKAKIFRVATDNKMGAPYLPARVHNHVILVLSLQKGAAPAVEVLPIDNDDMLKIGDQRVRYWEHLVEFQKGMQESIDAFTGG